MRPSFTKPEKRKPLTKLQRAKMFLDHNGTCVICGRPILHTEPWIDEHVRALELLGTNGMNNRGPAHVACARKKTDEEAPMMAKAKRQQANYLGAKKEATMPGSRNSKWKKKMNGTVERRSVPVVGRLS